jgi:hypothetical protein
MERSIDLAEATTVTMYDTIQIVEPVYDTTAVTVYDTVRLTVYDTVEVMNVLADTTGLSLDETVAVVAVEQTVAEPVEVKKPEVDRKKLEVDRLIKILEDDGITREVLDVIHGDVPQYTTVSIARLDSTQRIVIAATFDLQPDQIRRFRWGHSMAPAGPDAGRMFCAVWTDEQAEPFMLHIDP